jgi:GxxExxY protein
MDAFEFRMRVKDRLAEEVEESGTRVIGAAIEVHRHLGPGFPEIVYRRAICHELTLRRIAFVVESPLPVLYKSVEVGLGRLDLLVEERVIVELKAVEAISTIHVSQALAYLAAKRLQLALIINFNVASLKDGLRRVVRNP